MSAENVARARELFERVWVGRNSEALDDLCAPDCLFHDPLQGDMDRHEMKLLMQSFDRAFKLLDARIEELIDAGDTVVVRFIMHARMVGDFGAYRATNQEGSAEGLALLRFHEGKLVEQWREWNTLGFMEQLGVVPPHVPAGEALRMREGVLEAMEQV